MHSNFAAYANSNFGRTHAYASNKHYNINNLQACNEAATRT
jgi:hypothetical protein